MPAHSAQGDAELRALLEGVRSIAVVGIKDREDEDAYRVPAYLASRGYRILPVNPRVERVLGRRCHTSLTEIEESIDLVNLFRAPRFVPSHAEEILSLSRLPRAVWMQLGIEHPEAAGRLEAAGVQVVQDRCLMVDHRRLFPA